MANAGSLAKGFNATTALTGLSSSLVIQEAATFGTMVAAQSGSAALTPEFSGDIIQEFDGMVIVQPGTVWALLNTISTSAVSVCTSLSWEEVPL